MTDPRLLLDLYEPEQTGNVLDDGIGDLPWLNQTSMPTGQASGLSQRIQEWLGAKEPDEGGVASDILSARFQPSFADESRAAMQGAVEDKFLTGSDIRMADIKRQLDTIRGLGLTGNKMPSTVQTYEYYNNLPPEQRQVFQEANRTPQWRDAGNVLINTGTGQIIQKGLPPQDQPGVIREQKRQGAIGQGVGETEATQEKRVVQAPNIASLITEAKGILPKSTSGLGQRLVTGGARMAGVSTANSQADARLKVISAALTSTVPRFEGPQGVLDVELYKQAAADVANTELPYEDRLAALDTMETLNARYSNQQTGGVPQPVAGGNVAPEGTVIHNGKQTLIKRGGAWVPQ